jgi:hypothetical protein
MAAFSAGRKFSREGVLTEIVIVIYDRSISFMKAMGKFEDFSKAVTGEVGMFRIVIKIIGQESAAPQLLIGSERKPVLAGGAPEDPRCWPDSEVPDWDGEVPPIIAKKKLPYFSHLLPHLR